MFCCGWKIFSWRKKRQNKKMQNTDASAAVLVDSGPIVTTKPRSVKSIDQKEHEATTVVKESSSISFKKEGGSKVLGENVIGSNVFKYLDFRFRIMLAGAKNTGKSCLIHRFTTNEVLESSLPTVGCAFCFKNVYVNGKSIELQIWDSSGSDSCKDSMIYLRMSACLFLVYSVIDVNSFSQIQDFLSYAKTSNPAVELYLIGLKSDLEGDREVSYEDGKRFAENNGMTFFEASSKTGTNVQEIFFCASERVLHKVLLDGVEHHSHGPGIHTYKKIENTRY